MSLRESEGSLSFLVLVPLPPSDAATPRAAGKLRDKPGVRSPRARRIHLAWSGVRLIERN